MAAKVEPGTAMRELSRVSGLANVRLTAPDARAAAVRARVATEVAALDPDQEENAMAWIEAVAEGLP